MSIDFAVGFIAGAMVVLLIVWLSRRGEKGSGDKLQKDLENIFGNLSRQALSENQSSFFEAAKEQFESLLQKTELQMKEKSQVIDTTADNRICGR